MPSLDISILVALALTFLGLIAGCIRMFLGPTAADRVVCLDFLTILLVAITSLLALQLDNSAYLDLGLALALVGFLATVAFARYLETNEVEPRENKTVITDTESTSIMADTKDIDKPVEDTEAQPTGGESTP